MLVLLLYACSPTQSEGSLNPVVSMRVDPAAAELRTRVGEPASADFVAYATFADGTEEAIDLVSWDSSSPSAGALDQHGHFVAADVNGGTTTITATHAGIEGTAEVTVIYTADELVDLDQAAADAFVAATPTDDATIALSYPLDGVAVPRNLDGLAFQWSPPSGAVSRLHLQSAITDVSVYTTDDNWAATAALWTAITASNRQGEVTAQVETGTWDGTALTDVRRGPAIDLTVNRFDTTGSVLYWSTSTQGILRIPFGTGFSETFWSARDSDGRCTGCHTLVESKDEMVVTHDGISGTFSVLDVADPEAPEAVVLPVDTHRATFKTVSPDGEYILGANGGALTLYELDTGNVVTTLSSEGYKVTQPDWSPDGSSIVMVRMTGNVSSDMAFTGGEIVKVPWDGTTLGEAEVLVPRQSGVNFYYPAWSPDGKWIAYNRSTGDAYADPDAEIWLMSADGTQNVALTEANGPLPAQNSYVRWAPLPDDDVLWLAFSSSREYPLTDDANPQIWVSAIYPEEVDTDGDPSRPPFWLPGQQTGSNNHLPVWWSK